MGNQQVEVQGTPLPNREEAALRVANQTNKILVQCSACKEVLYGRDWTRNLCVCSRCNYHFPLTAHERIDLLVDAGSFVEVDPDPQIAGPLAVGGHPLGDQEPGEEEGRRGEHQEAMVIGCASIEGRSVALAIMDAASKTARGEKIRQAVERAMERHVPLLICCASEAICMQEEGFWWLDLASTAAALARLGDASIPYISVLTDPCIGASMSIGILADVVLAEPGCQVGFAHPDVIEDGMALPQSAGAFTTEAGVQHGFIDAIIHRRELRKAVARLLRMYRSGDTLQRLKSCSFF